MKSRQCLKSYSNVDYFAVQEPVKGHHFATEVEDALDDVAKVAESPALSEAEAAVVGPVGQIAGTVAGLAVEGAAHKVSKEVQKLEGNSGAQSDAAAATHEALAAAEPAIAASAAHAAQGAAQAPPVVQQQPPEAAYRVAPSPQADTAGQAPIQSNVAAVQIMAAAEQLLHGIQLVLSQGGGGAAPPSVPTATAPAQLSETFAPDATSIGVYLVPCACAVPLRALETIGALRLSLKCCLCYLNTAEGLKIGG